MKIQIITVTIEKLTAEGYGYVKHNDTDVFIIGALPGETVEARIIKKRKGRRWAVVEKIVIPITERIEPQEDHYLSCSPWQMFPYEKQIELKKQMLEIAYKDVDLELPITQFFAAEEQIGYRTKVETNFWYEDSRLHIAFHKRGTPFVLTPLPNGCILASPKMNQAALAITELINIHAIPKTDLKSLTIRESKTKDMRIALLCVKRKDFVLPFALKDIGQLDGLLVAFSDPLSPASLITKVLSSEGLDFLEETLSGITLKYPIDGFFQNNIPLFEKALTIMQDVVKSQASKDKVIELYSGVGTIGLALCKQTKEVIGVDIVPSSIRLAQENALYNNIVNYKAIEMPAEKMDNTLLADTDILVLDPPRTGLHSDVVNYIIENKPKTIIYLSCNPVTQARDYSLLKDHYSPTSLYGFDFYPNTMHMESLLILTS